MVMAKGPGLYSDIGKKARDLLYRDYQGDHKFTITTYTANGVVSKMHISLVEMGFLATGLRVFIQRLQYQLAITSTGTKKGELFLADVTTQLKNKNITTDIKVDTNSNVSYNTMLNSLFGC
ncbi:mitochondrial outer membrane protein porin of 36 kDa-like isoform X1 [Olea europaea var. sylvestris]|uniref:mitochondrial outer membrane protein porin of 36 kDa-like isoform X1 n=1 Tax=Olea europaea var. sylvestris TaxID=158386 RepID=UPI000C1D628B|nr:mitochondrial outer membrane protein porin of 36 kDa-like isoform X1 [Olea europaea var. sylvestris]